MKRYGETHEKSIEKSETINNEFLKYISEYFTETNSYLIRIVFTENYISSSSIFYSHVISIYCEENYELLSTDV